MRKRRTNLSVCVILCIMLVLSFQMVVHFVDNKEYMSTVPFVGEGEVRFFQESRENRGKISDVDATDRYIYFAYNNECVVSVYDWNGAYQYSIAFNKAQNGVMGIRCENEMLYAKDRSDYEYIFSCDTLIETYSPTQTKHLVAWFFEKNPKPVVINGDGVYDQAGNYIMKIP